MPATAASRAGPVEAVGLLRKAETLVDAATLAYRDDPGVAASVAVLGGFAAADALCCLRLGERLDPHAPRDALELVRRADPGCPGSVAMVESLTRVRGVAMSSLTPGEARRVVAIARRLVKHAERVVVGF